LFAVQVLKVVPEPILLYSVNTWLAYAIAEQYYSGLHYVWCTPHFDPSGVPSINYAVPPSSSPVEVYRGLRQDVTNGDRHSAKISANKAGILRGVEARRTHGDITEGAAAEIVAILDAADIRDFRPILFVIPFSLVRDKIEPVPVSQRAHPLSAEFIIERLPRNCFDAIGVDGI
jgi:hypothetical protein